MNEKIALTMIPYTLAFRAFAAIGKKLADFECVRHMADYNAIVLDPLLPGYEEARAAIEESKRASP